jgi:hypothetical protein
MGGSPFLYSQMKQNGTDWGIFVAFMRRVWQARAAFAILFL